MTGHAWFLGIWKIAHAGHLASMRFPVHVAERDSPFYSTTVWQVETRKELIRKNFLFVRSNLGTLIPGAPNSIEVSLKIRGHSLESRLFRKRASMYTR